MVSSVRYVRSGGVHIAYEVEGTGPIDLIHVVGATTHLEATHDLPLAQQFFKRFETFSRQIRYDQRGTGMSDPVALSELPTLEERVDDLRTVLDAAKSDQVVVFSHADGGPTALLFAATYPERTRGLIVYGGYACLLQSKDHSIGWPPDVVEGWVEAIQAQWGTGAGLQLLAPSLADGPFHQQWALYERRSNSPGQFAALTRMAMASDVRHLLPAIKVPTLVLHRPDCAFIPVGLGREIADGIQGAIYRELAGADYLPFVGDSEAVVAEVEEFVTGSRKSTLGDRVLSTVMFTDIAGSTSIAATMGDRAWRALLDDHDAMVRRQADRYRGQEVKSTGDGFLLTFDGPARAILCANAIREGGLRLGLDIRAGLHTGETEIRDGDVGGIAVHIASRVTSLAEPGEILVSNSIPPLVVGSGIGFSELGPRDLKDVPGTWTLYSVQPA